MKNKTLNIIYVSSSEKGPSGGVKILYDHSHHINKIKLPDVTSEVLHIKKKKLSKWKISVEKRLNLFKPKFTGWNAKEITIDKKFKSSWFKNKIKIRKKFLFDKNKDFVIFPEIFAHFAKDLCIKKKIPYAIFALNGYTLKRTDDYKTLDESYRKAKFILTVSNNITECVKLAFPFCSRKILKTNLSVDFNNFNFKIKKSNLITYMSRKSPEHSELVLFFLRNQLSRKWKIKELHNLKETEVYKYLLKSKIFLAFTQFEGLGMPPIEAAMAGNKIIGYTGEGGKEIWNKPIFSEIPNGNIMMFVNEIMKSVKIGLPLQRSSSQRKKIISLFSLNSEKKNLIKMISKIKKLRF